MFRQRTSSSSLRVMRSAIVAAAALTLLSACSTADSAEPFSTTSTVVKSTATAGTVSGTAPPTTTSLPASTIPAPTSGVSVPDGYPIEFPPGGDVTDVTEEIENNSGTDQLVTRVGVWYDGGRLEEFAVFYLNWIVDNGYLIGDSLINEDERSVIIRGVMAPENDTYGLTMAVVGDSTVVSTLWGRPPG